MSKRTLILVALLAVVVLGISYTMAQRAKADYLASAQALSAFETQAKALKQLKQRFDKHASKRTMETLSRIAPVQNRIPKANAEIFVYENLSASTLSRLLRKIENSSLQIKNLEITRVSDAGVNLRVEIAK